MNKANFILDKIEQVVKKRDSDEVFVMELTQDDGLDYVSDESKLEVVNRCQCHASMDSMIKALLERMVDIRSTWHTVNKALEILQTITTVDHLYQSSYVTEIYKACKIKDHAPYYVQQSRRELMMKLSTGYAKVSRTRTESSNKRHVTPKSIDAVTHSKDDFNDFISSETSLSGQSSYPIKTQITPQNSLGTTSNNLDDVLFFKNQTNNSMSAPHSEFDFPSYQQQQQHNQSQFSYAAPTQSSGFPSFGNTSNFSQNGSQIGSFAQTSFSPPQQQTFFQQHQLQQQNEFNEFPQHQYQQNFGSQGFGIPQPIYSFQFPTQNNHVQPVMFNTLLHQENKNSLTYMRNHGKQTNPEQSQSLDDFMQDTLRKL